MSEIAPFILYGIFSFLGYVFFLRIAGSVKPRGNEASGTSRGMEGLRVLSLVFAVICGASAVLIILYSLISFTPIGG